MKKVFLVINYNDATTTEKLIENIKDYPSIDLIIVLDNKSSDDSFAYLYNKYYSEDIHVIQSEANKGYAYAINYGCNYATALFGDCNLIVSNSDIEIGTDNVVSGLVESKKQYNAAIVAPIIREHTGFSKGIKTPTPSQDAILNMIYIHRFFTKKYLVYNDKLYKDKNVVEVDTVLGCFFLIDTRALKDVGYFDEHTFLYYEEHIIGKKLKGKNYKVIVDLNVEVFHNHSVSIDKSLNRLGKLKQLKKSQYYFQTQYNHANILEKFLLNFTRGFSYIIFKVVYSIKS